MKPGDSFIFESKYSEEHLEAELGLPGGPDCVRDGARQNIRSSLHEKSKIRKAQIGVVENIEEFASQFELNTFTHGRILDDSQVYIFEPLRKELISTLIAESSLRLQSKGTWIVIVGGIVYCGRSHAGWIGGNCSRTFVDRIVIDLSPVVAIEHVIWSSSPKLRDESALPPTQEQVALLLRKQVDQIRRTNMPDIEGCRSVIPPDIVEVLNGVASIHGFGSALDGCVIESLGVGVADLELNSVGELPHQACLE
jgi:uncharacterized membrane protein